MFIPEIWGCRAKNIFPTDRNVWRHFKLTLKKSFFWFFNIFLREKITLELWVCASLATVGFGCWRWSLSGTECSGTFPPGRYCPPAHPLYLHLRRSCSGRQRAQWWEKKKKKAIAAFLYGNPRPPVDIRTEYMSAVFPTGLWCVSYIDVSTLALMEIYSYRFGNN